MIQNYQNIEFEDYNDYDKNHEIELKKAENNFSNVIYEPIKPSKISIPKLRHRSKYYNPIFDKDLKDRELQEIRPESFFAMESYIQSDNYIPSLKRDLIKIENKIKNQKSSNVTLESIKIDLNSQLKYFEIGTTISIIILIITVLINRIK